MKLYTPTMSQRYTRFIIAAMAIVFCALAVAPADAQSKKGSIAFGFDGGTNKYYGNFTDSKFGTSGDLFIRWNIMDWLALHAAYNAGQLRYGVSQTALDQYPNYFGKNVTTGVSKYPDPITGNPTNITIDPTNVIRTGGWELLLSASPFPSQTFVPYFVAGIEELNFEPKTANGGQSLPNNARVGYSKDVLGGVLGVGYDLYITNKVTFNGKLLLHLTGTDWLDDYSDPTNFRQDAFLTFGVGFGYVIFSPPEEKAPAQTTTGNVYNNTTENYYATNYVNRTDTIYVQGDVDTIYLRRPQVNTILNFPGTLFIVNTDEFNMKEPGNATNLRRIKELVEQCPEMRIEVQGFASNEGTAERNQELSELRAKRIKTWLVAQGVNSEKIANTVGYGTSRPMVNEPSGVSAARLEEVRVQNRRIAVRVVETCNR